MSPKTESESGIAAIDRKKNSLLETYIETKSMTLHDKTLPQNVLPVVPYVISLFASLIICLFFIKGNG